MSVHIKKGSALSALPLTPLIDMVFLLLIFFLVATRFSEEEERELAMTLADASEAQPLTARPQELFINIDRQGRFYAGGQFVTLEELDQVLARRAASNPGRASAVVRADRDCRWQPIVAALNLCKKNRVQYTMATLEAAKPPPAEGSQGNAKQ